MMERSNLFKEESLLDLSGQHAQKLIHQGR